MRFSKRERTDRGAERKTVAAAFHVDIFNRRRTAPPGIPGAGGFFPLGFAGQAEIPGSLLRQPLAIGLRIKPGDIDRRPAAPAPTFISGQGAPGIAAEKVELRESYLVFPQPEIIDKYLVGRMLVVITLAAGRANSEITGRDMHHDGMIE